MISILMQRMIDEIFKALTLVQQETLLAAMNNESTHIIYVDHYWIGVNVSSSDNRHRVKERTGSWAYGDLRNQI